MLFPFIALAVTVAAVAALMAVRAQLAHGEAASRMDAVPEARVTVTGLMPAGAPPHLELLGYHVGARRPIAGATTSRDIAATHLVLETPDLAAVVDALERAGARFVSPGIVTMADGAQAIMVLDPDGHRLVVRQTDS